MEIWLHAIAWKRTKDAVSAFRAGRDAPEATIVATTGTISGTDTSQGTGVGTTTKSGERSTRDIMRKERRRAGSDFEKAFINAQKDKYAARNVT
jgi:hypothetical protein